MPMMRDRTMHTMPIALLTLALTIAAAESGS
jgi:hypothetical protein